MKQYQYCLKVQLKQIPNPNPNLGKTKRQLKGRLIISQRPGILPCMLTEAHPLVCNRLAEKTF